MGMDDLRKSAELNISDLGATVLHVDESNFLDNSAAKDLMIS